MTSSFQGLTDNSTGATTPPLGTIAQRPGYTIASFTASGSGTWTAPSGVSSLEVLVVAGGGGGGKGFGGGGGGGGVVYQSEFPVVAGTTINYSVGSGGAAGNNQGSNGLNSWFLMDAITNGTFTTNTTGWTANGSGSHTFSASGGVMSVSRGAAGLGAGEPVQQITVQANKRYLVIVDVGGTPMSLNIGPTQGTNTFYAANLPVGRNYVYFTPTTTTAWVLFIPDGTSTTSTVDNVSISPVESSIIAIGGGGGGGGGGSGAGTSVYGNLGGNGGGSSGFSGGGNTDGPNPAASGMPSQGWGAGRGGSYPSTDGGGGGGGAGGPGTDCQNSRGGDGGMGVVYNISGSAIMYGSGGGGNNVGIAQSGGGNGSSGSNTAGSGTTNTGGGGGGSYSGGTPGAGGSGVIVIRYSTNTATTGMVRYNTSLGELEGFANGTWNTLGHNTSLATGMVFIIDAANPKSSKAGSPGIKDLCGTNHIGQLNNSSGVTWTPSAGGAWYFDGTGHAKFPTNATAPYINVTGNISVNLWCYIIGGYYIVSTGGQTSSTGFAISYQGGSPFVSVNTPTKQIGGSNVVTMPTGRWVNLSITYNNTTPTLNYYINGALSQNSWAAASTNTYTSVFQNLTLGVPNNNTSAFQFNGYISHLSMWSRELSATEVATNFSALKTRHNV
jgi:hypothetical protein